MNPLLRAALILVGAYVAYEAIRAAAIKQMGFSIDSIIPQQNGLNTLLTANIRITNPTDQSNKLDSFTGTVTANGNYLGFIMPPPATEIIPNGQTVVPVTISISDASLLNTVLGYFSGSGPAVIVLMGTAMVNSLSFPVNLTFQINS